MWVSRRRRPITSPPGGGTTARPKRASSGPASRNEARISRQRRGSSAVLVIEVASTITSFGPVQAVCAPRSASSSTIVSTSRMRGTFVSDDGRRGEHGRRQDRERAVLVARRTNGARERATAFDDERLHAAGYRTRPRGGHPRQGLGDADPLHAERVAAPPRAGGRGLRAPLRAPASARTRSFWGCAALLHDFDYEIHPTLDEHPQDGAPILREEGYPEVADRRRALARRAPRDPARHAAEGARSSPATSSRASSTRAGSCGPTGLEGLEPKSVRKKLKQPSFAAGVHRDEVYAGAELIGLELDEHIANVVAALQPIAAELGLRTAADSPPERPALKRRARRSEARRRGQRARCGDRARPCRVPGRSLAEPARRPRSRAPWRRRGCRRRSRRCRRRPRRRKSAVPHALQEARWTPSAESGVGSQRTCSMPATVM